MLSAALGSRGNFDEAITPVEILTDKQGSALNFVLFPMKTTLYVDDQNYTSNPPRVAYRKYRCVGGGACCLEARRIPSCLVLSITKLNQREINSQNQLLPSLLETLAKAELKIVKGKNYAAN